MLSPYRQILRKPGSLAFSSAGALSRMPGTMITISLILMISQIYHEYSLAGRVSAVFVTAQSLCAPQLAKLVDSYGQARIMRPALAVSIAAMVALLILTIIRAPEYLLYLAAGAAGATVGSMGAMVRSRWAQVIDSPRELHVAFSFESAVDEFLFVIGPVFATFLVTSVSPYAGISVAILLSIIGGFSFLALRSTEPPAVGRPEKGTRRESIVSANLALVALTFIAMGVIFGSTDVATVAYTRQVEKEGLAGVLLGIFALGSLIAGLLYGARHFSSPTWKRFVVGAVALAVSSSFFSLVNTLWLLGIVMFIAGFAIAPTIISGNALVQEFVPAQRLTEGLAWVGTSLGMGFAAGSAIAGSVVDSHGAHAGYFVVVSAGVATAAIASSSIPLLRRNSRPTAGH